MLGTKVYLKNPSSDKERVHDKPFNCVSSWTDLHEARKMSGFKARFDFPESQFPKEYSRETWDPRFPENTLWEMGGYTRLLRFPDA